MAKVIHILNGPNLNMLGRREAGIYGTQTLDDIEALCATECAKLDIEMVFDQTNSEGELVTMIQNTQGVADGIIINAGAYTHTSIAVHDALRSVKLPVIEIHLSNVFAREEFRHHSYISPVALGVICGFGTTSYTLAITALAEQLGRAAPGEA